MNGPHGVYRTLAVALAAVLLPAPLAAQSGGPLLKSDLVRMMTASNYTATEMAAIVRMNCVGFEPTERDRSQLGNLPNAEIVLAEVDRCMTRPVAAAGFEGGVAKAPEPEVEPAPPRPKSSISLAAVALAPTETYRPELAPPEPPTRTLDEVVDEAVNPKLISREIPPELTNWKQVSSAFLREYRPNVRTPGRVLLWLRISPEGEVVEARVKEATGDPSMSDAALRATAVMKFKPALMRDKPVESWTELPIVYNAT